MPDHLTAHRDERNGLSPTALPSWPRKPWPFGLEFPTGHPTSSSPLATRGWPQKPWPPGLEIATPSWPHGLEFSAFLLRPPVAGLRSRGLSASSSHWPPDLEFPLATRPRVPSLNHPEVLEFPRPPPPPSSVHPPLSLPREIATSSRGGPTWWPPSDPEPTQPPPPRGRPTDRRSPPLPTPPPSPHPTFLLSTTPSQGDWGFTLIRLESTLYLEPKRFYFFSHPPPRGSTWGLYRTPASDLGGP